MTDDDRRAAQRRQEDKDFRSMVADVAKLHEDMLMLAVEFKESKMDLLPKVNRICDDLRHLKPYVQWTCISLCAIALFLAVALAKSIWMAI